MGWLVARRALALLPLAMMAACSGPMSARIELQAQPAILAPGEPTTLSWHAWKLQDCEAQGAWAGARASSGTLAVTPPADGALYRLSCRGPHGPRSAQIRVGIEAPVPLAFPLHAGEGARYLRDASGRAVLIQGDAAWSLIAATRRADVERYLDDRRARGFNAVIVNLIEHKFAVGAPRNAYGVAPFRTAADFSTPDAAYFDYADWVIGAAEQRQIAVFLVPGYLGYGGGDEGWYRELAASPPQQLRAYGRYVGARLGAHRNIVWVFGGDYNPPERAVVTQIAAGVAESVPLQLATAHCAPESAATQIWGGEPWLTLNTEYSYRPIADLTRMLLQQSPLPLVLIESRYEGEPGGSAQRARLQAYQALLGGAAGQFFGMSPLWHFNGPGNFPSRLHWQQGLASEGSESMTVLGRLMRSRPWWLLEPDTDRRLLQLGVGMGFERAGAAVARDGSYALIYLPDARRVKVSLRRLAGPQVEARWFDPSTGAMSAAPAFTGPRTEPVELAPRGANARGGSDWVLVLISR